MQRCLFVRCDQKVNGFLDGQRKEACQYLNFWNNYARYKFVNDLPTTVITHTSIIFYSLRSLACLERAFNIKAKKRVTFQAWNVTLQMLLVLCNLLQSFAWSAQRRLNWLPSLPKFPGRRVAKQSSVFKEQDL